MTTFGNWNATQSYLIIPYTLPTSFDRCFSKWNWQPVSLPKYLNVGVILISEFLAGWISFWKPLCLVLCSTQNHIDRFCNAYGTVETHCAMCATNFLYQIHWHCMHGIVLAGKLSVISECTSNIYPCLCFCLYLKKPYQFNTNCLKCIYKMNHFCHNFKKVGINNKLPNFIVRDDFLKGTETQQLQLQFASSHSLDRKLWLGLCLWVNGIYDKIALKSSACLW